MGNFFLRTVVDVNYTGEHDTSADNDALAFQGDYTLLNLTLTLAPTDEAWDISFIGRNLTDEEYEDVLGYSTRGRAYYAGIRGRFDF